MTNPLLHRYWFEFDANALQLGVIPFCGVTAYGEEDARALLAATVFSGTPIPPTRRVVEDVDVSTLDAGQVLPNMLPPNVRGVWFPLGHQSLKGP